MSQSSEEWGGCWGAGGLMDWTIHYRGGIVLFACSSRLSRGHLVLTSRPVFRFLRTGPGGTFQMKLWIELADIWAKM